jgi:uncharacterized ferritin-like protein (DUF455 family)
MEHLQIVLARKALAGGKILRCIEAHLVNPRVTRASANQFDNWQERIRFTLQQEFDTTIGKIVCVSAKPMSVRRSAHKITKANTLHATAHVSLHAMHAALR